VLLAVRVCPGLSIRDLSGIVGLSSSATLYHVRKLATLGRVFLERPHFALQVYPVRGRRGMRPRLTAGTWPLPAGSIPAPGSRRWESFYQVTITEETQESELLLYDVNGNVFTESGWEKFAGVVQEINSFSTLVAAGFEGLDFVKAVITGDYNTVALTLINYGLKHYVLRNIQNVPGL